MLKRGEVKAGPGVRSGRITRAKMLERWSWERRILKKKTTKTVKVKKGCSETLRQRGQRGG